MAKWTMEDALQLIKGLQPETRRFGYHLCLGGGVLNKGESDKDLDLYFLPLDNGKDPNDAEKLKEYLEMMWGQGVDLIKDYDGGLPDIEFHWNTPPTLGVGQQPVWQRFTVPVPPRRFLQTYPLDDPPHTIDDPLPTPATPKADGQYKYKLKFERDDQGRIDCFIL